jgi:hypothetical protein
MRAARPISRANPGVMHACAKSRDCQLTVLPASHVYLWQYHRVSKISNAQVVQVRLWLLNRGFQLETVEAEPQLWHRDDCWVRVREGHRRCRVDVATGHEPVNWLSLDELVALRSAWPEASIMSPIELATAPSWNSEAAGCAFRRHPGSWLYQHFKPGAHGIKVFLQMLVGIGATADIGFQVVRFTIARSAFIPTVPATTVVVQVIAYALAVAAAIELAYTLFTPGPDEALDPLTLGLSSGLLLLITGDQPSATTKFLGVLLGVLALGGLFLIRRYLLMDDER